MALQVHYNIQYGEVVLVQQFTEKRTYHIGIYHANCVCAFVNKRMDKDGKTLYDLQGFLADYKHVNNLLWNNQELFLGEIESVKLNTFWQSKYRTDYNAIIKYFTRMGVPVTLYYKEVKIKEPKQPKITIKPTQS